MRSLQHSSASRSVGMQSVSITTPCALFRRSCRISSSVRFLTLGLLPGTSANTLLKLVQRRRSLSCESTSTESAVILRSISTMSAPMRMTLSIAGIEFSGKLRQSPRWQATTTYLEPGSFIWAAIASARLVYAGRPFPQEANPRTATAIISILFIFTNIRKNLTLCQRKPHWQNF